jgi:glycerophosphoryl diester phosphodiesterase
MQRNIPWLLAGSLSLSAIVFLNNTNLLSAPQVGAPVLLAHRGVAQQFDMRDIENDTCTASRMLPPVHAFLENTIASMRAGFEAGADVVEIDVFGPYHGGEFSTGIDTPDDLHKLPGGYGGGVMTNEIEAIAKALGR